MTTLNAKFVEEKLKRGWTTESFTAYLNMPEHEFLKRLHIVFLSERTYNSKLKKMKQNEKIRQKTYTSHHSKNSNVSTGEISQQEVSCEETSISLSNNSEQKKTTSLSPLESMKVLEKNISEDIIRLELENKQFNAEKSSLKSALLEEKAVLESFLKDLYLHRDKIQKILSDYNSLSMMCSENNSKLRTKKQELQGLRDQIKELEKIQIFFYEDGEIEFVNGESFEISETDCDVVFKEIITNPLLEKCTVRVIRQLSRLLVLTKTLNRLHLNFAILFDDIEVENLFKNISSN